jgi:hypothetical protein
MRRGRRMRDGLPHSSERWAARSWVPPLPAECASPEPPAAAKMPARGIHTSPGRYLLRCSKRARPANCRPRRGVPPQGEESVNLSPSPLRSA